MPISNSERDLIGLIKRAKMKFPDEAKDDLLSVLSNFHNLKPKVANYSFDDGVDRVCLSLSGTIPIHYKGGDYNIPITLYLRDNHPYSSPFCSVKPTSNMAIKASAIVDTAGRIYLPYLHEWQFPNYDTSGLLQVMTICFQEKCPVYSVSSPALGKSTASSNANPSHQPNPPYPNRKTTTTQYPSVTRQYPRIDPPYPTSDPPSHLMPQPNVGGSGGYPMPAPPFRPAPPPPSYPSVERSTSPPNTSTASALGTGYGYSNSTIQPAHIRASLLSAVEDKIRQKIRDKLETPYAELQSVDENLKELHNGKQKLREMMENISRDHTELDRILSVYTAKKEELERALKTADESAPSNGGPLNPEDAIDAQTPVHKQILMCYVQDCAIDDTIYSLGKALRRGTITLQMYLKHVRQLSHQQFQQRLLMQKCRERAHLPI